MNHVLKDVATTYIIKSLSLLPEGNQRVFKLMYGRKNGKRSVEDAEAMSIEDVVAEIEDEKLDWAMQQVINSMEKFEYNQG